MIHLILQARERLDFSDLLSCWPLAACALAAFVIERIWDHFDTVFPEDS